jgi:hypothetical protein
LGRWLVKFVTLGPTGTCHENATRKYLEYHCLPKAEIILRPSILEGLEDVRAGRADYLVQCSAHLEVHLVTEKYLPEILVTDTFMYPTKEIVLLENAAVEHPQTLGLVKPTEGYLGDISYPRMVYEPSKPVVGAGLLAGKYDAGLTYPEYIAACPERFRVRKYVGAVLTTWLVYGRTTAFDGVAMGIAPPGYYLSPKRSRDENRP